MPRTFAVYISATWVGFLIMGVELLSGRIMAPWFGSSIYVWGAIITVFMLSLSIGYYIGGRFSLRDPSLARLGGIILLGAACCLPTIFFAEVALGQLFDLIVDPRYGSLSAAMVLFFVPTTILGMVSPYSVRLLTQHHELSGQNAGTLYFASTMGSAVGTIATSFYLVLWFEINTILWGLIGISMLVALPLILFSERLNEDI